METLGKYEIREELGRGGFGTVYRALDTTLKREVALKVFNPALLHEAGWLARFQREAQFIAALEHPRIVTVYEIAEAESRVFIAMKLLRGPSLDKVLAERGALPWERAQRITLEVAEALAYAHAQGVLHRDLKPANIVLDAAMGAVLTDFGFARLMGDTSLSLSVSGGLVGTPHYIAPELWQNQPASPASDLYALGCILYEMVLGRKAFPGNTSPAVMMAHFQPLALPETWTQGTPPGLTDVLQGALAQAPEARTPTLAAFVDAVSALQVDPLAEPYAALERAVTAGEWEQARQLAEAIHAQNPAYRDTAQALEKAKAEIARAELIAQWRNQAETALQAGQWMAARAAAEQWLRLAPEDGSAQAVVGQTDIMLPHQLPAHDQPVATAATKIGDSDDDASEPHEVAKRAVEELPVEISPASLPSQSNMAHQFPSAQPHPTRVKIAFKSMLARINNMRIAAAPKVRQFFAIIVRAFKPLLERIDRMRAAAAPKVGQFFRGIICAIKSFNWLFLFRWLLSNVAGGIVGGIVGGAASYFEVIPGAPWAGRAAIGGSVGGVTYWIVSGVLQWVILKPYIRKAGRWLLASVLGGVVCLAVHAFVLWTRTSMALPIDFMGLFSLVGGASGLAAGWVTVGLRQWLILRSSIHKAGWWLLSRIMGLAAGLYAGLFAISSLFPRFPDLPENEPVVIAKLVLTTVLVVGAVSGLVTGPVLTLLLRRSKTVKVHW